MYNSKIKTIVKSASLCFNSCWPPSQHGPFQAWLSDSVDDSWLAFYTRRLRVLFFWCVSLVLQIKTHPDKETEKSSFRTEIVRSRIRQGTQGILIPISLCFVIFVIFLFIHPFVYPSFHLSIHFFSFIEKKREAAFDVAFVFSITGATLPGISPAKCWITWLWQRQVLNLVLRSCNRELKHHVYGKGQTSDSTTTRVYLTKVKPELHK